MKVIRNPNGIIKNTFGVSLSLSAKFSHPDMIGKMVGSSLDRITTAKKQKRSLEMLSNEELINAGLVRVEDIRETVFEEKAIIEKPIKLRSMSNRTKTKVRKKIIAFARIEPKLTFATLTFTNQVSDKIGISIFSKFLENYAKLNSNFQYIWVAEKQTKNETFKENIHFHLISNQYWKIKKTWSYWIELQSKHGIKPRNEAFNPSSAFDVKKISSTNLKSIGNYLTKYVTKNASQFECQVWNCSKKISTLYTDFYSDDSFLKQLERLESAGLLGGNLKTYEQEYCSVTTIPLNRITTKFYSNLDIKNNQVWKQKKS